MTACRFLIVPLQSAKIVVLIIGISSHERSRTMESKETTSIPLDSMYATMMVAQWALVNILERKGILTQQELMDGMDEVIEKYESYPPL